MRLVLFLFLFSPLVSQAQDAIHHNLSLAGGIAHPGRALAISQNPAGLIYNRETKVHVSLAQAQEGDGYGYGGGAFTGSDTVGGGAFIRSYNTEPASAAKIRLLDLGIGAIFSSLDSALGIGVSKNMSMTEPMDSSNSCGQWCLTLGMITSPSSGSRIGLNVVQASDSSFLIGAGWASDYSQNLVAVLDAQMDPQQSTIIAKPGLGIFIQEMQLTASYGVKATGGEGHLLLRKGWSLGLSVEPFRDMVFEAYINQFTHFYLGMTMPL